MNKMTEDIDLGASSQALAQAIADVMYIRDQASQGLGIKLLEIAPGSAKMSMPVRQDMLNGHATCHGGFIFTLADSAFAYACNSRNQNTVASGCAIDYLAPGFAGDVLFAQAIEQARSGKAGVYDVSVTNQDGKRLALFRGKSHQIKGEIIPLPAIRIT